MHQFGADVVRDLREGARWYRRAAEQVQYELVSGRDGKSAAENLVALD